MPILPRTRPHCPFSRVWTIVTLCTLLSLATGCTMEQDDAESSGRSSSPLEEIQRQLNQPIQQSEPNEVFENKNTLTLPKGSSAREKIEKSNSEEQAKRMNAITNSQRNAAWPPKVGFVFPVGLFLDSRGQELSLESLRGKVILVEFAAMLSPDSQALAGSSTSRPFSGVEPSKTIRPLRSYFPQYTRGIEANRISFLQIVFRDLKNGPPSIEALKNWSEHFKLSSLPDQFVVTASAALVARTATAEIPGFLLLDKNLVVRADATGINPTHNLFRELLPMIPSLLEETNLPPARQLPRRSSSETTF